MTILIITLSILALLSLTTSFVAFKMTFYSKNRKALKKDEFEFPPGKEYEKFYENIKIWSSEWETLEHEEVEIQSKDGLTLRGRYFEKYKGAPIELMFHGYKGSAKRDMAAGIKRAFSVGRNALLVDQRGSGLSDGNIITFGVKEKDDCLRWIDFMIDKFGKDVRIVLTGISMGAATVMLASSENLPSNVISVLADCGYSSGKEMIIKVINDMHLPGSLLYPFVRLGGIMFGHFDVEKASPYKSVQNAKVPIIFIHGGKDDYVPFYMSEKLYNVCCSQKKLVIIPDAYHGVAYPENPTMYINAILEFQKEVNE